MNRIKEKIARPHKVWVDWMKALGMLTIVWGHCFPEGMNNFLYAFNVPVFFLISGYLTRRESSMRVCFDKCLHNLIIPYFILAFIKCAAPILKHISDGQYVWSLIGIFGGFHSIHGVTGCNNLWFVYTLVLIKFLYQLLATNQRNKWIMVIFSLIGAWVYNYYDLDWTWAVTNMFLALPFFMLGNWCSSEGTDAFDKMTERVKGAGWGRVFPFVLVMAVCTWLIGYYNDAAYLFEGRYGNHLLLFAIASLTGCMMMYLLSLLLDKIDWKVTRIISAGTIIILVFHRELLHPLLKWMSKQDYNLLIDNILLFLIAGGVTLAFVPIILIVKRVFPIVLGRRAKAI